MWSVWSDPVDLYLGQRVAMLQAGRRPAVIVEHPNALPVGSLLAELSSAMAQIKPPIKLARNRLRIVLGGALCPAIGFAAPPTVTRWDELRSIATATAAMNMGVGAEQTNCDIDVARQGVAGAVPSALVQELGHWAAQHRCSVASVQPLWALASQSRAARAPSVQGVLVEDPDSLTLLMDDYGGGLVVSTFVGTGAPGAAQTQARRWLVNQGLEANALLKLCFGTQSNAAMLHGPHAWANHWYLP